MIRPVAILRYFSIALAGALMACSQPSTPVPAPPDWLEVPAEYPWGDVVASRDSRLARHVTTALNKRFGAASETHAVVADGAGLQRLRDWYRGKLPGWIDLTLSASPGETVTGWSSGDRAMVIGALPPQADGRIPLTIFRFGPNEGK